MTIYIHRELACDHGGAGTFSCTNAYHSVAGQRTARLLRRDAKKIGWTRRDGSDVCPEHSAGAR